jgi:hypothetical protein
MALSDTLHVAVQRDQDGVIDVGNRTDKLVGRPSRQ